jgi:hypothetical protein
MRFSRATNPTGVQARVLRASTGPSEAADLNDSRKEEDSVEWFPRRGRPS